MLAKIIPQSALGPVYILCATALMAFQDGLVKGLSLGNTLWQIFMIRSALVLPFLLILMILRHASDIREAFAPWVLVRSTLIVLMYVFFYASLPILDLPLISAIYYTGPIFILILSALLFKNTLGPKQVISILLAFAGVLIILQPDTGGISAAALIPFLSALCYAFAMITTGQKTPFASPWALVLSVNILFVIFGGAGIALTAMLGRPDIYPFLTAPWGNFAMEDLRFYSLLALISIGIHLLLARAYQLGPTTVVAGLDFSYLIFASLWSLILFGTTPTITVIGGSFLIAAAGLWSLVHTSKKTVNSSNPA